MPRLVLATLAAVALTACASSGTPSDADPFTGSGADDSITILGTVTGLSDEEFTLDWSFSEPIRIEIDLVAGPSCTTREIRADPGDVLELQIASVFTESQACR